MGKQKDVYEKEIVKVIRDNKLFTIKDIFAFYSGIKSSQFYNLGLEKSELILKAIDDNKTKSCQSLKKKWLDSDNPTLQIAVFKTICTDEDRKALSQTYHDHTTDGEKIQPQPQLNESQIDKLIDKL